VSRCSTPGPSELDDEDSNENGRDDDDDDDDVGAVDSEEEREELNKRETPRRDLTKAFIHTDTLPAHSA